MGPSIMAGALPPLSAPHEEEGQAIQQGTAQRACGWCPFWRISIGHAGAVTGPVSHVPFPAVFW